MRWRTLWTEHTSGRRLSFRHVKSELSARNPSGIVGQAVGYVSLKSVRKAWAREKIWNSLAEK